MPIPLQVVIESQAKLQGFDQARAASAQLSAQTLGAQRQITAQFQAQAKAQADVVRAVQQQQSLFQRLAGSFRNSVGMGGGAGAAGLGGMMGSAAGWAGAAAGTMVAGLAYKVADSFRQIAQTGLQLADVLGDVSEQLGVQRTEMVRLREGASFAGVSQRTVMRSLGRLGQLRGLAMAGDQEAMALLGNYGISQDMVRGGGSNAPLAETIARSLGKGGIQPQDDAGLRRIFGENYKAMLASLGKMPEKSPISEEALREADRVAASFEYGRSRKDLRAVDATRSFNPFKWTQANSAVLQAADIVGAYFKQGVTTALTEASRTAGTWTPAKLREKAAETQQRMAAIEFSAPSASGGSRRGLFASAADYRLSLSQLNLSKSMLKELEEIRAALTRGLKWEET
jgi:hypothetical protein